MPQVIFDERASKALVQDYNIDKGRFAANRSREYHIYKTLLDMAEVDPVLSTAMDLMVDMTTMKGYDFFGENKNQILEAQKRFKEINFEEVIDNIIYQLVIFGDAFLEKVWNDEKTKIIELNPLPTEEMDFEWTEHGEIKHFVQKPHGFGSEKWIFFKTDEVIYFRMRWIGNRMKSRAPFNAIARDFSTNVDANTYLKSIFQNLPPKIIYFLKTSSDKNRKEFIENLIRSKTNPNMDIIMQGESDSKLMQVQFDKGLLNVLEWIQKRVLMITRVPPHWVGMLNGANRGIGENVVIPFESKLKKIQRKIAMKLNSELMEPLGFKDIKYQWNAMSLMDEKEIILNMGQLDKQGFDSETIIEYGRDHGLNLRQGAKIEKEDLTQGGTQIQNEGAPSRQGKGKSDKMTNNIDKKGVSAAGKEKLQTAQAKK